MKPLTSCYSFRPGTRRSHSAYQVLTPLAGQGILDLAKDLLRYSSLRMNEIAQRCGFKDPTHFFFLFRKRTGSSPKDYRTIT